MRIRVLALIGLALHAAVAALGRDPGRPPTEPAAIPGAVMAARLAIREG